MAADNSSNLSMRLFGIPYQFPEAVDPRLSSVSKTVGTKFLENIMLEAPVCTIIPGEPYFLPGDSKEIKVSTATALLEANEETFKAILNNKSATKQEHLRLYDFKNNYTDYIKYVNVLCRTGAAFLGLDDTLTCGDESKSLQQFNWANYKWSNIGNNNLKNLTTILNKPNAGKFKLGTNNEDDMSMSLNSASQTIAENTVRANTTITNNSNVSNGSGRVTTNYDAKIDSYVNRSVGVFEDGSFGPVLPSTLEVENNAQTETERLEELLTNYNFVQFYIDSDVTPSESISNSIGQSMFKSFSDTASSGIKDLAFMANSGGIDTETLSTFIEGSQSALQDGIGKILGNGTISGALSRIVNLGSNVLQGHNIAIPDIYQNSEVKRSYSITVHLKTPYGTKLGYYLDIFVPMMHLLALALPKQETANTYSSPFLLKAYVDGVFTCNLGMVDSISITKANDSWSSSGLPNEVDVTLSITDLYSSLSMSPSSDPIRFMQNSSLIEYLATNCGLSLTSPNLQQKWDYIANTAINAVKDVPDNLTMGYKEKIHSFVSKALSLV